MRNKTWWYMVLWGIVRAVLAFVGGRLSDKGLIDAETHQRLLSEGVTDVVGWLILFIVMFWTVFQKSQVFQRILTAIHLQPRVGRTEDMLDEVNKKAKAIDMTL